MSNLCLLLSLLIHVAGSWKLLEMTISSHSSCEDSKFLNVVKFSEPLTLKFGLSMYTIVQNLFHFVRLAFSQMNLVMLLIIFNTCHITCLLFEDFFQPSAYCIFEHIYFYRAMKTFEKKIRKHQVFNAED